MKLKLNDFLELEISVSVKVVQVCIDHLMTEHIVILLLERENNIVILLLERENNIVILLLERENTHFL